MITVKVSNSVNNAFIDRAEELLSRNSQDIHSLCTELCTFESEYCTACPQVANRQAVHEIVVILTGCLTNGWRCAISNKGAPPFGKTDFPTNKRVENLTAPYTHKGWLIGCYQVEACIKRGHHVSQTHGKHPNSTQGDCPEDAS